MNRQEMDEMWDECRDGDLSGQGQDAFDEHMLNDPDSAALWGAESRWLESVKDTPPNDSDADSTQFCGRVLERWDTDCQRRARVQLFWRRVILVASCATAAAIVVLVTWTDRPDTSASIPVVHVQPVHSDPVSILVTDMTEQVSTQPQDLYNAVRGTGELLTIEQAMRMFGVTSPQEDSQQQR